MICDEFIKKTQRFDGKRTTKTTSPGAHREALLPGGSTLGIFGWGCAAGTPETLAYITASSASATLYYRKIHYLTREFRVKLHAKTDTARIAGDSRLEASVDEREVRPQREPVPQSRQQGREILKRTLKCWILGASLTTPSISFRVFNVTSS